MTPTLPRAPLAPLLERLFKHADDDAPLATPAIAPMSAEEQRRMMRSKTSYREFYGHLKDSPLAVSRETGVLLYKWSRPRWRGLARI